MAGDLHKPKALALVLMVIAEISLFFSIIANAELQRFHHPMKNNDLYWVQPEDHHYDWRDVAPRPQYVANLLKDLDAALKESTAEWKVVVGHHPIRSVSEHGDTQELLELLLPMLKANEVDLYLNGHDHCLEHISSIDSPIQYFTSGAGSKAWRGVRKQNADDLKFFYDGQGFMSMNFTKTDVKIVFYDVNGQSLYPWNMTKQLNTFM